MYKEVIVMSIDFKLIGSRIKSTPKKPAEPKNGWQSRSMFQSDISARLKEESQKSTLKLLVKSAPF